jgi:H+/Cl- antiporter ClcA
VIRWLRLIATATVILSLIGLGVISGLLLVANNGWVSVKIPPWLQGLFENKPHDVWLPALIGGWLATAILLAAIALWSMYYVWRRRQYESLINRLEKELAKLRNLPFEQPAPFEDLPETPSAQAARVMSQLGDGDDADDEPEAMR